jgi:hypothetical protein
MTTFTQVILFTDTDGRARFREQALPLPEGTPSSMLSALMPSGGLQLRHSPVGFRSSFHVTITPQWVFILSGQMQISLQDGSSRVFGSGEHFYSDDTLPAGATFDPTLHGHWSRQLGDQPLVTAFVRG